MKKASKQFLLVISLITIVLLVSGCGPYRYDTPRIMICNLSEQYNREKGFDKYLIEETEDGVLIEELEYTPHGEDDIVHDKFKFDFQYNNREDLCFGIKDNYAVIVGEYRFGDNPYFSELMQYHKKDTLLFLNTETECAEILFESKHYERILYGTHEYVILYNWIYNEFRYVSIADGSVIKTQKAYFNNNKKAHVHFDEDGNIVLSQGDFTSGVTDSIELL